MLISMFIENNMKTIISIILVCFALELFASSKPDYMDLSGKWSVALDKDDKGVAEGWCNRGFEQNISLPSTIDQAGLTNTDTVVVKMEKLQLTHLVRKSGYVGAAWYTREISMPNTANRQVAILELERVLWKTTVWVDGQMVKDTNMGICTPQRFSLTDYLAPGKTHRLTMRIDNREQRKISNGMAHSYTDHTQIRWNGVIGKLLLHLKNQVYVDDIQTYPNPLNGEVKVQVSIVNESDSDIAKILTLNVINRRSGNIVSSVKQNIVAMKGVTPVDLTISVKNHKLWSEFTPELYRCQVALSSDKYEPYGVDFGFRHFKREGTKLTINSSPLFLRGTLECCIFPLTGHPPMDKAGWQKVFGTAREWGLNHIRFHSWCPPKAAFEVADELGFYLQVELPVWVNKLGEDKPTVDFMYDEAYKIIKEYGNHPSFCMWALGNELEGDYSMLSELLDELKSKDNRHLYTTTAFTFQKGHGHAPEHNDDFFITQWTDNGWVRGQGVFNSESPTFNRNYQKSIDGIQVPIVTHEIGQYAVYPNMNEIDKYTGVLNAVNFKSIRYDLQQKSLLHKADSFTKASGKLAVILYKEEMERALKTPGISGFQLLDLHDFPGQGTALVGLLDAFWDSKELIEAKDFRNFCSPIVPLASFDRAVYYTDENYDVNIEVSNYSLADLSNQTIVWSLKSESGIIKQGEFASDIKLGYNSNLKRLLLPLNEVSEAQKLTFEIALQGTDYKNSWTIHVYPRDLSLDYGRVLYTRNVDEALRGLSDGKSILFNPQIESFEGIEGKFVPVFWSPVHFPKQAGTMGILCDPKHEALRDFPTDIHTNWQWWDLNIHSKTLIVDKFQGGEAVVELIDNFANNRKLAMIYEGKVGNGKLMIVTTDLSSKLEQRPVAKQLLYSLLNYMNSELFNPKEIKNSEIINPIFNSIKASAVTKELPTNIY